MGAARGERRTAGVRRAATTCDAPHRIYRSAPEIGSANDAAQPASASGLCALLGSPSAAGGARRGWAQIRPEAVACHLYDRLILDEHVASCRSEPGTAAARSSLLRLDERRTKAVVHRTNEQPRAAIAHAHPARSRGDGPCVLNRVQELRLTWS